MDRVITDLTENKEKIKSIIGLENDKRRNVPITFSKILIELKTFDIMLKNVYSK